MESPTKSPCGASTRAGAPCRNQAGFKTDHPGFGNCHLHGGATTNGRKHARTLRQEAWDRLTERIDPMLTQLDRLAMGAESEAVQLAAARDWLDRAGMGAKQVHEVTGPDGGPIPIEVRTAELLARAKALAPAPKKAASSPKRTQKAATSRKTP